LAQQEEITMVEFMRRYGTEEACREHLYQMRWPEGFICPKCGIKDNPFNIKSRNKLQCRHCNHQASVTAGTIMDKSRTKLTKWFLAIYLIGTDKRGCSALRLKKELKIAYDTAWTMSHKIRNAMAQRDSAYRLTGIVDMDESFFGAAHIGGKRGRGADKTAVVFALSHDKHGNAMYLKAKAVGKVDKETISSFSKAFIEQGAIIQSDGLNLYQSLNKEGYIHMFEPAIDRNTSPAFLHTLHTIIANVKVFILGTYHGLDEVHLQTYLDEFVYRFNRRSYAGELFNRTVNACLISSKFTRYDLIG